MPSPSIRHVREHVANIARKTAEQVNPIVQGTVLSRNPDGSLNVDDGRGGCVRVAPRGNYRVGQKVVLGTEPGIGQQTNLPVVTVTLGPSQIPCPSDPRFPDGCEGLVGVPCAPPVDGEFASAADLYAIEWVTLNFSEPYPGTDGSWTSRRGSSPDWIPSAQFLHIDTNRKVSAQSNRRAANYSSHISPAFADRFNFIAGRVFLSFDTSPLPANAQILSASLQVPVRGNTPNRVNADLGASIYVVPSSHNGIANVFNWSAISNFPIGQVGGPVLGQATIGEIHDAGPDPEADVVFNYTFDLADDPTLSLSDAFNPGGTTRLALVASYDYNDQAYPAPASFINLSNPNEVRGLSDFVLFANNADLKLFVRWTTGLVD